MHTSFGLQPQLSITLTMDSGLHCLRREIRDEWRKRERDAMKIRTIGQAAGSVRNFPSRIYSGDQLEACKQLGPEIRRVECPAMTDCTSPLFSGANAHDESDLVRNIYLLGDKYVVCLELILTGGHEPLPRSLDTCCL